MDVLPASIDGRMLASKDGIFETSGSWTSLVIVVVVRVDTTCGTGVSINEGKSRSIPSQSSEIEGSPLNLEDEATMIVSPSVSTFVVSRDSILIVTGLVEVGVG